MAPLIERRSATTTRTTTRTEPAGTGDLKTNLTTVQEELARVRDSARQEAESLERIRGLLDADALNGLIRTIEEMEARLEQLQSEAAGGGGVRAELEQEQERLRKLWDAYKSQEDELNRVRRDYPLMEEKLFERERTIESLRREISRLEPLAKSKREMDDAIAQGRQLRAQVEQLNNELRRTKERNDALLTEAAQLREDSGHKGRVGELEAALEEERERLAKLYKVYEDQEAEKKDLESSIASWEAWFTKYGTLMDRMCGAAGEAPSRQK
jgi:chromosome segregation ATPase